MWTQAVPVRLGEYAVAKNEGRLAALGLGSCVAVIMYDPVARVGGLAHVVLPSTRLAHDRAKVAKYGETAAPFLLGEMMQMGASPADTTARLVGGASMFSGLSSNGSEHMGERNIAACRAALDQLEIRVVSEDVGSTFGRSVVLNVADGSVIVRSVGRGERRV